VQRWDLAAARPVQKLKAVRTVRALAWRPDSNKCAVASTGAVRLMNTKSAEIQELTGHPEYVFDAAWSPDGKKLVAVGNAKTILWAPGTNHPPVTLDDKNPASGACACSPDGTKVVTNKYTGPIKIWDAGTGKLDKELVKNAMLTALRWSPDGKKIAAV